MINQKVNSLLSRLNLWSNPAKEAVQERLLQGPIFIGSKREFKRYVGPVLRNLVQQITKKHRKEVGHCQHCKKEENLQSAHVAGRNRNHIIDDLLKEFQKGDLFQVNLKEFENRFKEEHEPLEKSILILCKSCHLEYDSIPAEKSVPVSTTIGKIDAEPVAVATTRTSPPKKKFTSVITSARKQETKSAIFTNLEFTEFKQMKIGKLVRATLPRLIKLKRIGESELLKLQDAQYSKIVFDVNYPVLKKVDERFTLPYNRTVNGYPRYYAHPYRHGDSRYLITSEWYDRNHENYLNWITKNVQKG